MKWSQQEAVEILGISDRHLRRLVHAGTLTKSGDGFDQARLIAQWIIHKSRPDQDRALLVERTRLVSERADRQAWDNQKCRDELLSTDEAMTAWRIICEAMRKRISAITDQVAPLLLGRSMAEAKEILDGIVREALTDIASPDITLIGVSDQDGRPKKTRA